MIPPNGRNFIKKQKEKRVMGKKVTTATHGGVSETKGRVLTATTERMQVPRKIHEPKGSKVAVVGGMPDSTEVEGKVVRVLY